MCCKGGVPKYIEFEDLFDLVETSNYLIYGVGSKDNPIFGISVAASEQWVSVNFTLGDKNMFLININQNEGIVAAYNYIKNSIVRVYKDFKLYELLEMISAPLSFIFPTDFIFKEYQDEGTYYVGISNDLSKRYDSVKDTFFTNLFDDISSMELDVDDKLTIDDLMLLNDAVSSSLTFKPDFDVLATEYFRSVDDSSVLIIDPTSVEVMEDDLAHYNDRDIVTVGILFSKEIPLVFPPLKVNKGNYPLHEIRFFLSMLKPYYKMNNVR